MKPLPVCQHMRRLSLPDATSQLKRLMGAPCGANPHDQLSLKYQPTPLASFGVSLIPVSRVTSASGACAANWRLGEPTGRQPSSNCGPLHAVRIDATVVE